MERGSDLPDREAPRGGESEVLAPTFHRSGYISVLTLCAATVTSATPPPPALSQLPTWMHQALCSQGEAHPKVAQSLPILRPRSNMRDHMPGTHTTWWRDKLREQHGHRTDRWPEAIRSQASWLLGPGMGRKS